MSRIDAGGVLLQLGGPLTTVPVSKTLGVRLDSPNSDKKDVRLVFSREGGAFSIDMTEAEAHAIGLALLTARKGDFA